MGRFPNYMKDNLVNTFLIIPFLKILTKYVELSAFLDVRFDEFLTFIIFANNINFSKKLTQIKINKIKITQNNKWMIQ